MAQRGRISEAELAVAPVVHVVPRPKAPDCLTDKEAGVWESYVSSMPGDFWRASDMPQLEALCRHVVAGRRISLWIEDLLDQGTKELEDVDRLHKMRERETRAATALARTLRLTKQSQLGPEKAHTNAASDTRPWDDSFRNPLTWEPTE